MVNRDSGGWSEDMHIRSAPEMKIIRMGLRPCESPRRLQKPVEMALRTLIVVTTADAGRKSEDS